MSYRKLIMHFGRATARVADVDEVGRSALENPTISGE